MKCRKQQCGAHSILALGQPCLMHDSSGRTTWVYGEPYALQHFSFLENAWLHEGSESVGANQPSQHLKYWGAHARNQLSRTTET